MTRPRAAGYQPPDVQAPDPRLHPPSPRLSRPQVVFALIAVAVLVGVIALGVALAGKGGDSIHPKVTPASPVTTMPFSRFP
jgi:uncharacterized RDD family membrane protein YckC